MNYADIKGGTWYPQHGMYSIVEAMVKVAKSLGVQFKLGEEVMQIVVENGIATQVISKVNETRIQENYSFDVLIGAGDYHHIETKLLEKRYQSYSAKYWDSRVLAPSSLLYYLGLNKKLKGLRIIHYFLILIFQCMVVKFIVTQCGHLIRYFMLVYLLLRMLQWRQSAVKIYFYSFQ